MRSSRTGLTTSPRQADACRPLFFLGGTQTPSLIFHTPFNWTQAPVPHMGRNPAGSRRNKARAYSRVGAWRSGTPPSRTVESVAERPEDAS